MRAALASRILRTIEQRAAAPWYCRAWQQWPLPARIISFAVLLAMFGGICLGVAELLQAPGISAASNQAGEWLGWLTVILKTLSVLVGAVVTAVRQLGMGFVLGCVTLLLAAYAVCIGLGTACVRLAWSKR